MDKDKCQLCGDDKLDNGNVLYGVHIDLFQKWFFMYVCHNCYTNDFKEYDDSEMELVCDCGPNENCNSCP
jgi:hypothetical protein